MSKILSGNEDNFDKLPENMDINDLIFFKYALITFMDVESSFFIYKTILTVH